METKTNMKITILGSSGQIGAYLSEYLRESDYGCKVVEMKILEGYSLFDWYKVLENAKEINMVETSLNFLLESPMLFDKIKDKKLTLHYRGKHNNYSWDSMDHKYIFNLPWNYS